MPARSRPNTVTFSSHRLSHHDDHAAQKLPSSLHQVRQTCFNSEKRRDCVHAQIPYPPRTAPSRDVVRPSRPPSTGFVIRTEFDPDEPPKRKCPISTGGPNPSASGSPREPVRTHARPNAPPSKVTIQAAKSRPSLSFQQGTKAVC